MNEKFNWEDFEQITKSVVDVICGDKVEYICSGKDCNLKSQYGNNQFDVLYKWNSEIKNSYIAIECKYWNSLVDKDEIRDFDSKCNDCKIDTKIIVSKKGFTNRATLEAEGKNIQLIELRDFSDLDFEDCFRNRILGININMKFFVPKVECRVSVKVAEKADLENVYPNPHLADLIFSDNKIEALTSHVPLGNVSAKILMDHGFKEISQEKDDTKTITVYRKQINCDSIKYEGRVTKVKEVIIDIKETLDQKNVISSDIKIDYKEEIKKAGYLVAKKIIEKSNFVLDLKNKNIVDKS